jgi:molecular chaperone GrpE
MTSTSKQLDESAELDITMKKTTPIDELNKVRLERDEYLQGWKRALADYENYKKEQTKRTADLQIYQVTVLFRELLPLFDTLTQALKHIPPEQQNQGWYQGLQAVYMQWKQFLASNGINSMESEGATFNPELHEAIAIEKNVEAPDNSIISVASEGYMLNNETVVRPAKVIVNQLT